MLLIVSLQGFERSADLEDNLKEKTQAYDISAQNVLDVCDEVQSENDFLRCEESKSGIIENCKKYPTMTVCNDPRLQKLTSVAKVSTQSTYTSEVMTAAQKFNEAALRTLDVCTIAISSDVVASCKISVLSIKEQCADSRLPPISVCNDPRLDEILNQVDLVGNNNQDDAYSRAVQVVSDFLDKCSNTTTDYQAEICAKTAKEMMDLCNSMQGGIPPGCSDPRLAKIAGEEYGNTNQNTETLSLTQQEEEVNSFILKVLSMCTNPVSYDELQSCKDLVIKISDTCKESAFSQLPACDDSRIYKILNQVPPTNPEETSKCKPDLICFRYGDYMKYENYYKGKLDTINTYIISGEIDFDKIMVEHHMEIRGDWYVSEGKNPVYGIEARLNSGIYDGDDHILRPIPITIEKWLEDTSNPEYWKDKISEGTFNYKGMERTVIIVSDVDSEEIIDKESGILLFHKWVYGQPWETKLVDTNMIQTTNNR